MQLRVRAFEQELQPVHADHVAQPPAVVPQCAVSEFSPTQAAPVQAGAGLVQLLERAFEQALASHTPHADHVVQPPAVVPQCSVSVSSPEHWSPAPHGLGLLQLRVRAFTQSVHGPKPP